MPVGWAAAAGAVGSIGSGVLGYLGQTQAANAQKSAAEANLAFQQQQAGIQQQNEQPFRLAGQAAIPGQQALIANDPVMAMLGYGGPGGQSTGFNTNLFQSTPGYNWLQQQTLGAGIAGAKGNLGGNTLSALQQNASGIANNTWSQWLSALSGARQTNLTAGQNLINTGQNAVANAGSNALGFAGNVGSAYGGIGNAGAVGATAAANNFGPALTGSTQNAMNLLALQALQNQSGANNNIGVSAGYDPSQYGYTAGGAGAGTLSNMGFFNSVNA